MDILEGNMKKWENVLPYYQNVKRRNCFMESSLKELAGYRLARAKEMLSASESNLKIGQYKTSLNRSYYAVFHAMRSANVLKGF